MAKDVSLFKSVPVSRYIDEEKQVMIFERGDLVFAFNFSPNHSYERYSIPNLKRGIYLPVLTTDEERFDGYGRASMETIYRTRTLRRGYRELWIYLPSRSAVVLRRVKPAEVVDSL